jgi:hypothetical protein
VSITRIVRWRAVFLVWLAVVAWLTLRSAPGQAADVAKLKWYCIACGDAGGADVILNVLLFFPLGLALRALGWPAWRTLALLASASIAIEVTQATLLVGRDASLGDVLSNSTGAMTGWIAYGGLVILLNPTEQVARRSSVTLLALMALLWWTTGAALRPSLTKATPWVAQRLHVSSSYRRFPGSMQAAAVNGVEIPNALMTELPDWRDTVGVVVDLTRDSSGLYTRPMALIRVVDSSQDFLLGVDQIRDDARLRLRLRGNDWLLHSPRWLVSHGMAMPTAEAWRIRWSWERDRITLASEPIDGPQARLFIVPLSAGLGWVFIHPFVVVIGSNRGLWTALWLGWWFGWLGWLAGGLKPQARWLIGGAGIAVFVGASIASGLSVLASEVAFAAAAYVVFVAASSWLQPRARAASRTRESEIPETRPSPLANAPI